MQKDQELRERIVQLEELAETHTAALAQARAQLELEVAERTRVEAERERLLVTERAKTRQQGALVRLSAELAATLDEIEVCRRVVHGLRDTLGHDIVALFLVDEITGERVLAASVGYAEPLTPLPPGQGLSERPLLNGQLHYTPDVTEDPRYFYGMGGAEVDVPIRIGGKVLGVLTVESNKPDAFGQDDLKVFTAAAQQAGLAIEKARLLAAERQRADHLDALRTTMADITAELELSSLLQAIVERAAGFLDATGGELGLYNEASQTIRIVVSHNLDRDYVGTRLALGEGAMGRVAETGEPLIVKDYHTWEGRASEYADLLIHASITAPLEVASRLVGAISIVTTDPMWQFGPADLHLLNLFAQQAAIAIENARLYDQSQREIAERKKIEEEIRCQKEYYEALFVNNPAAVVTADLDGRIVSWNPMAEKLFGYTQEEVIGKDLDDFVANDDSIRAEAAGYTDQVINLGRVQVSTRRTRRDGSLVDVELLALPVIVAGEKVGFIAIYVDIADLQKARREAEAANQAKSDFLANMSHELRTPLNAILGFTQLMDRDTNLTAEQQANLRIINQSGEHLLTLINDVLEMSKIEAGRATLQEKSFDLHHLLDGLEEMFRLRAEGMGLALSFERAEDVPQYVLADEGKLRQVLMNLLGNGVKFTEEGGVALRVRTLSRSLPQQRGRLLFEVEDTGPGIAPEELEKVFEPFVQTASGQRSLEGTGLGLSISRQFARLMGGDITASSKLGQGSVFSFEVLIGLAEMDEVQMARPSRQVIALEPGQPVYQLLVVDDRETTRRLLVNLLEPLGFEVREASNGQEAIEIWERWEPDLIWMDMRMPVMDGYEATRRIKATSKGQSTIVVALTASAFEEDREAVLSAGCDDVMSKPFRKNEIFDMLAKHLGVRLVYEEERVRPAPGQFAKAGDVLTPEALATLPPEWLADLRQAAIRADLSLILTLVGQIREENGTLADALADLIHNFEYRKILALIEQAGG